MLQPRGSKNHSRKRQMLPRRIHTGTCVSSQRSNNQQRKRRRLKAGTMTCQGGGKHQLITSQEVSWNFSTINSISSSGTSKCTGKRILYNNQPSTERNQIPDQADTASYKHRRDVRTEIPASIVMSMLDKLMRKRSVPQLWKISKRVDRIVINKTESSQQLIQKILQGGTTLQLSHEISAEANFPKILKR